VVSDDSWVRGVLIDAYGARDITPHELAGGPTKRLYRVERTEWPAWLVRSSPPAQGTVRWHADAAVLVWLESHAYPAPRVVRTLAGAPMLEGKHGSIFVTTFVDGAPLTESRQNLFLLGQTVGRLHALPTATAGLGQASLPAAGMLPPPELAFARSQLATVVSQVPAEQQERFVMLAAACNRDDWHANLPVTLIHNDCHPGNSVSTPDGNVVLIDWEGAGLGPAILDLGFLLVSCAIPLPRGWDQDPPSPAWTLPAPDLGRLRSVIDGYRRERLPSATELEQLPEAMRFRSLVAAACSLAQRIRRGLREDPSPWWWARYIASDALAEQARQAFP